MKLLSPFCHNIDDDGPKDYSFVSSVNEGMQQEQQKRTSPYRQARLQGNPFNYSSTPQKTYSVGDSIPENPYLQPHRQVTHPKKRRSFSEDNNTQTNSHVPQHPTALQQPTISQPQQSPYFHHQQYQQSQKPQQYHPLLNNKPTYSNYHANQQAQYSSQDTTPNKSSFSGYTVEEEVQEKTEKSQKSFPWLLIAVCLSSLVCIVLLFFQFSFNRKTEQLIQAEKEAQEQILYQHPQKFGDIIEHHANDNNLHPAFVTAIILNESSFNPSATSSVGARGLMQLMDETAGWIYEKRNDTYGYNFDQMYEIEPNITYGCWYLNFLSERFYGDPILVAAAYHAGQTTVQNWLNNSRYSKDGISIELDSMMDGPTKQYVTRVLSDYATYKRLYYPETEV